MKKVLFCAALMAAMSMVFVACGKKDNANAENEGAQPGVEQLNESEQQAKERDAIIEGTIYAVNHEKLVKDIEKAVTEGDYNRAIELFVMADLICKVTDFTEEQKERILEAYGQLPEKIKDQYRYEE